MHLWYACRLTFHFEGNWSFRQEIILFSTVLRACMYSSAWADVMYISFLSLEAYCRWYLYVFYVYSIIQICPLIQLWFFKFTTTSIFCLCYWASIINEDDVKQTLFDWGSTKALKSPWFNTFVFKSHHCITRESTDMNIVFSGTNLNEPDFFLSKFT